MSGARRVPVQGELVTLPIGGTGERDWYVSEVQARGTASLVTLEYLLDRAVRCTVLLFVVDERGAA